MLNIPKETMYLVKIDPNKDLNKTKESLKVVGGGRVLDTIEIVSNFKTVTVNPTGTVYQLSSGDPKTIPFGLDTEFVLNNKNGTYSYLQHCVKNANLMGDDYYIDNIYEITIIQDDASGLYYTLSFQKWSNVKKDFYMVTGQGRFYIREKSRDLNSLIDYPFLEAYRFSVNPKNIIVTSPKINTKDITSSGISFQYWGNDVTTIEVKGQTLSIRPTQNGSGDTPYTMHPVLATPEYQNLKKLQREWYMNINDSHNATMPDAKIGFYYRGILYIGHFDRFVIPDDAEQPYTLNYEFTFTVEDTLDYPTYKLPDTI